MAAVLTYGNPHVYLDTMVLIGTVSLQFEDAAKIAFGLVPPLPVLCFAGLGYGARHCQGLQRKMLCTLDATVAVVMLVLAFVMARAGGWL